MAGSSKLTLGRILLIACAVLAVASIIGRVASGRTVDENFVIKTLTGYGIAAALIWITSWVFRNRNGGNDLVEPSPDLPFPFDDATEQESLDERDDMLYARVADELSDGAMDKGAWTQAFSKADGDDAKTKAFYIKIRIKQLQREEERRARHDPFEQSSREDQIRLIVDSLRHVEYENTEHIAKDDFHGYKSSLAKPVAVSEASSISGMMELEIIDLIKRGFLEGLHEKGEWYFELKRSQ